MFLFLKTLSGACHRKLYFSGENFKLYLRGKCHKMEKFHFLFFKLWKFKCLREKKLLLSKIYARKINFEQNIMKLVKVSTDEVCVLCKVVPHIDLSLQNNL